MATVIMSGISARGLNKRLSVSEGDYRARAFFQVMTAAVL